MRILQLVAGEKWTGTAAVVFEQTAALVAEGVETQFGFVEESPLARRLLPLGWARPVLAPSPRGLIDFARDARRLREIVLREKFDVVHAHGTLDHSVAAFALRGTSARLVRTLHNLRHAGNGPATRALFGRTEGFAFANRAIAEKAGRPGPIHSPVVDAGRFRPGEKTAAALARFGLPAGVLLIGTVEEPARERGHAEAIDAAAAVSSAGLVHVGHGEEMANDRARAVERGAGERNFWLGYQEEALPELYRCWDAFLFTASCAEQGQRAILEAMASGLPVVALDLPGVRDLITDGQEGLVVEEPRGLVDALRHLASSGEIRRSMAEKARARALEFTPAKFAARAKTFYEELRTRPPAPLPDAKRARPSRTP